MPYPVDASDCFKIGIMGGCGFECPIYLEGNCEFAEEKKPLTKEEKERHFELYGIRE